MRIYVFRLRRYSGIAKVFRVLIEGVFTIQMSLILLDDGVVGLRSRNEVERKAANKEVSEVNLRFRSRKLGCQIASSQTERGTRDC